MQGPSLWQPSRIYAGWRGVQRTRVLDCWPSTIEERRQRRNVRLLCGAGVSVIKADNAQDRSMSDTAISKIHLDLLWCYFVGVIGTAMIVASMVAITFSLPPLMAKASAVQTVSVRPAFFTCALATKTSPAAGARRFTFSSTVRTSLSSGARVKAA
jgi:hypothetical protein